MSLTFVKFPDIELFHNVVKTGEYYNFPTVFYRNKIKLHGTNAGVRLFNGLVGAQSRTQAITPENDNAGFARWVFERKEFFACLPLKNHTIFGEFCGPGIMKGTAINQIAHKVFAIFAIMEGDGDDANVISCPVRIGELMGVRPNDIHILPWACEPLKIQFGNRTELQAVAEKLNSFVKEIEPCDPWVKATFGVEGTAEGSVYYPTSGEDIKRKFFSDFVFKAKGEQHKVIKTKEAVQVDPEVAASIDEFVTMFVTEVRCEQGLNAIGGKAEAKNTGAFLKWFMGDVLKESVDELVASNLTWDQVSRSVQFAARTWFLNKGKEL